MCALCLNISVINITVGEYTRPRASRATATNIAPVATKATTQTVAGNTNMVRVLGWGEGTVICQIIMVATILSMVYGVTILGDNSLCTLC